MSDAVYLWFSYAAGIGVGCVVRLAVAALVWKQGE